MMSTRAAKPSLLRNPSHRSDECTSGSHRGKATAPRCRTKWWVALLATTLLAPWPAPAQTSGTADEPKVVIWRTLRNDFHDKTLPDSFVNEVVTKTPSALIAIGQNETLSSTLQRTLNISATWTPALYREMVARIADLNQIQNIDNIPAGTELLVPQVPTVGKKYNVIPKSGVALNVKTGFGWTGDAVANTTFSNQATMAVASQAELQYFTVPISQATSYLLDNVTEQGVSGPVAVTFTMAQDLGVVGAKKVLSPAAAALIKSKLEGASGPRPVLVVVDDSVPDNVEYVKAKAFVLEVSRVIRETYALGGSPYVDAVKAMPEAMIAESATSLYPNLRTHASLIKQSLQEFAALDPFQHVSIVYIPLGATQVGVAPLLRELLYLAQIIKVARPPLPPKDTTSDSQRTRAQTITEQILASNKDTFAAGVLMPLDSSELSVTTDSLFLEALGIVMSYYADASRRPYVLSFSWTAKKFTYPTYFDASTYGLKFAAAGNQKKTLPGLNFLHAELEYASRAATSQDFVVVMNSTGTPSTCPSNLYDDTGLDVASVAYPGEVTALYCGTSFSTPRAAWLAAARDAAIGRTLGFPVNKTSKLAWLNTQHKAILELKQSGQQDILGRYSLDVEKYFSH